MSRFFFAVARSELPFSSPSLFRFAFRVSPTQNRLKMADFGLFPSSLPKSFYGIYCNIFDVACKIIIIGVERDRYDPSQSAFCLIKWNATVKITQPMREFLCLMSPLTATFMIEFRDHDDSRRRRNDVVNDPGNNCLQGYPLGKGVFSYAGRTASVRY